ncbi:hypothetical protein RRG08_022143 [Elysia crispata]|uniref:VLRF1 domain-containing protein n=1 Tax=Elysia crispata TaxID=231223 RepID=A0AAE0Y123_9GAST|nr:hypothetical protein RRG08_022143 [Elysia crispata]
MEENKNSIRLTEHYVSHSLFDTKTTNILDGLDLAYCNTNDITDMENEIAAQIISNSKSKSVDSDFEARLVISETKFCNACQIQFADREEQVLHYKSDWHRYNLHLRVTGAKPVTEDQFETMSGDVSSISGSDDEDSDDQNGDATDLENQTPSLEIEVQGLSSARQREQQKVYFKNENGDLISVHRCLLHHKKNPIYEANELISAVAELPKKSKWAVLMVTCGHFAGAIFNGKEILEHKTFHRYTVRKKRGTAQSSHDNKGRQAKSAGAHLRRYNEAALVQEVQELLNKWQELLESCHFVFVRIPVANRGMFYGGKNAPFKKDDFRICVIPFPTRRPTFSELKRVQQMLASVECYGKAADIGSVFPRSPRRYFDKKSGQLEISRCSTPEGEQMAGKMKSRPGSAKTKAEEPSVVYNSAVPEEEADDKKEEVTVELVEIVQEINLSELKEFECLPRRKRVKGKEKDTKSKIADFSLDEREIRWKNSLFTASKTGNENIFKTILKEMTEHHKEVIDVTASRENSASPEIASLGATDECLIHQTQGLVNDTLSPSQKCCNNVVPITSIPSETSSFINPSNHLLKLYMEQIAGFLNRPLGDGGQTFLHVAAKENQAQLVHLLLEHGANPALKDKTGKTPYNLAGPEARNTFRRFMSLWPDRYDYTTAQIPSPLTEEMEQERKRKMAEKRKAKKKAANERNKEKKEALLKQREEEKEKERFLALSDREKRALAAEKRILQQHDSTSGSAKPVLSRCWACAIDITGKVPFEYSDYKFCTTKCLREHRSKMK